MKQPNRSYSLEYKLKAVELSNHRGSLESVANELGISSKNISRWRQQYNAGMLTNSEPPPTAKSKEAVENIALRKALKDAEMERDILKKALGIFSKSDR